MLQYLVGRVRHEHELTMRELAERAKISRSYLQRIEAGEAAPSLEVMLRIAHALNVPLSALYRED